MPWLLLLLNAAQAACGLDACPIEGEVPERARVQLTSRYAGAPDGAAWYAETLVGGHVRVGEGLRLSAQLPMLVTRDAYGLRPGLGDSLLQADLAGPGEALRWGLGVQLELPTNTLATDTPHLVALPYLRAQPRVGAWDLRARAGWAKASTAGPKHEHPSDMPQVQVNPHSDSELLLRGELGWTRALTPATLRPGLSAELVQGVAEPSLRLLTAGPTAELDLGVVTLRAAAEWPLLGPPRFDQRVSVSARADLPPR
ncbi:MAG: hypothetical protein H6740_23660 [Alphaproteobacteria bacterium]|nr:hypothetical protein [Alphaproteobacteria bacterium]